MRNLVARCVVLLLLLLVPMLTAPPSLAAGTPAGGSAPAAGAASHSGWQFEATPYLWGAGLDGEVGVGSLPAQGVEASFSDITSILNTGGMLTFEGHNEHWGFLVDAIYIGLSDSTATPNQKVFGDVDVDLTQQSYMAGATLPLHGGKVPVDLVVGARYNSLTGDLELTSGIAQGRTSHADVNWWQGVAGLRFAWGFAKHWDLVGYGEVGGGSSNLAWQALVGTDWNFSHHLSGRFGYRYISLDYDNGDFSYDMDMAGPYAGLGIRF